jgi:prepilin-type N-terminal cleavage/methylation domain-containing protein
MRNPGKRMNHAEEGYTLIETLVAMALFASVLIPLLGTMGSVMLHDAPEVLSASLREMESEFAGVASNHDFRDAHRVLPGGLILLRTVHENAGLVTVAVEVRTQKGNKQVLRIDKLFIKSP